MKLKEFISILEQNSKKELLFEYASDKFAGANYHLTEVKNVQFDTTDCGGKTNFWKETQLQIWESPSEIDKKDFMQTDKILSILNKVDKIKSLMPETELKIEYGNENFPTSVMPIEYVKIQNNRVVISLFREATRCKANDICGISEEIEEEVACCSDSVSKCC